MAFQIFNKSRILRSQNLEKISSKLFSAITKENKKVPDVPLYVKRDDDFKVNKIVAIKKLEELLNCKTFIAKDIVLKYKKFAKISGYNIAENYSLCIKNGILHETITKNPQLLAELDMVQKLNELKKLPYNINATALLLVLSLNKLKEFVRKENINPRISVISKILEIDEYKVCECLLTRPFLSSIEITGLESKVELLTACGISKEDIIKDLWVLRYKVSVIKEKFDIAKTNNVDIFKTWMVRAQPEIFEKYVKRRSENKSILGENSIAQYLSERLQCTEEIAKYLIFKHPPLQNKSLRKMNEMIDFLFEQGFKPIHICKVPKILLHSVETTKKRLKEVEALGLQLDTLSILTKSQKQYMQYYDSLKTNKNKMKSY